ncbi:MAG TPA: amidase, partial [bacterium]|nr:amidase [bacterium]
VVPRCIFLKASPDPPIVHIVSTGYQQIVPPVVNHPRDIADADITLLSVQALIPLLKSRQITSQTLVEAYIQKIKKVNPALNAVVRDRFDEAREEALRADVLLSQQREQTIPLLTGIPCTIKEAFAVRGMPQTSGLVGRQGQVAEQDAPCVHRLRQAGAIVLGVTNVSELCMWMESANKVYGRTNNPHDTRRIAGGSSGGEGAIIGAGASLFGLGSDVGGSIRMPAFFNGVFGHKPSSCIVPNEGQFPGTVGRASHYLTTGILCRYAKDLMPLMSILATPAPDENKKQLLQWPDSSPVDFAKITVVDIPGNGMNKVAPDVRQSQARCAEHFRSLGAKVVTREFKLLKKSFSFWAAHMSLADEIPFGTLMGQGQRISVAKELARWLVNQSDHTFPAIMLALLEQMPVSSKQKKNYVDQSLELKNQVEEAMGPQGVLLYPTFPTVAPRHNAPIFKLFPWVYTAIFNALEFPATSVPLGLNKNNLPLGLQVVSRWGADHLTIACACELEKRFGGWSIG